MLIVYVHRYLSTIMLPVAFLVIFWPVVFYKLWFTNDITKEMKAFPYYKFAVMGLFDTAFSLFSTFPIQHLGGDLSNVLSQSVLPINMMFAAYFLGTKFKKNHYLGAALVIYGIAIKLSASSDFSGTLGWIFVMVLAQVLSFSSFFLHSFSLFLLDACCCIQRVQTDRHEGCRP